MRTGLTKKQKTTVIYFDEHSRIIEVQTHNTDLKKRLTAFAAKHPQCCRQTGDDEQGGLTFEIEKGRLSFRLTAPYIRPAQEKESEKQLEDAMHEKPFLIMLLGAKQEISRPLGEDAEERQVRQLIAHKRQEQHRNSISKRKRSDPER